MPVPDDERNAMQRCLIKVMVPVPKKTAFGLAAIAILNFGCAILVPACRRLTSTT